MERDFEERGLRCDRRRVEGERGLVCRSRRLPLPEVLVGLRAHHEGLPTTRSGDRSGVRAAEGAEDARPVFFRGLERRKVEEEIDVAGLAVPLGADGHGLVVRPGLSGERHEPIGDCRTPIARRPELSIREDRVAVVVGLPGQRRQRVPELDGVVGRAGLRVGEDAQGFVALTGPVQDRGECERLRRRHRAACFGEPSPRGDRQVRAAVSGPQVRQGLEGSRVTRVLACASVEQMRGALGLPDGFERVDGFDDVRPSAPVPRDCCSSRAAIVRSSPSIRARRRALSNGVVPTMGAAAGARGDSGRSGDVMAVSDAIERRG